MRNSTTLFKVSEHLLVLVAISFIVASCTGTAPPVFNGLHSTLSPSARTEDKEGVRVTAEVFADRDRCKTYFKLPNAYANGLAILFVKAENLSPRESLILQHSNLRLLIEGSGASEGNTKQNMAAGEATAIAGAAIVSMPLLFLGASLISQASVVQENFVKQEFRDDTIPPGASASGFLYFQLDKSALLKHGGTVVWTLRRPNSTSDITVEIAIPSL